MEYATKKLLTKDQFKPTMGEEFYAVIRSGFYVDKALGEKLVKMGKKKPEDKDADLLDISLVIEGKVQGGISQMVVCKILKDELEAGYPKGDFKDKAFGITIFAKTGGKRYNTVSCREIELPKQK